MVSMIPLVQAPCLWLSVVLLVSSALVTVFSACPRDGVSTKAHSCFTHYSFHFQNMQNSPHRLCCGVDVEILRAFCQSYTSAVSCVDQLKRECPVETYPAIDKTIDNLSDVRRELHELCSDDSIIEIYARVYQTCFTQEGDMTDRCLQAHFNTSYGQPIKFLSKVVVRDMDQFCTNMRNTIECVRRNVKRACGDEAVQLVPVLIKPMIRQSTECDYSVIHGQGQRNDAPPSGNQKGSKRVGSGSKNGAGGLLPTLLTLFPVSFSSLLLL